jgi:hypothetical protein
VQPVFGLVSSCVNRPGGRGRHQDVTTRTAITRLTMSTASMKIAFGMSLITAGPRSRAGTAQYL